jgi:hypothetical protein
MVQRTQLNKIDWFPRGIMIFFIALSILFAIAEAFEDESIGVRIAYFLSHAILALVTVGILYVVWYRDFLGFAVFVAISILEIIFILALIITGTLSLFQIVNTTVWLIPAIVSAAICYKGWKNTVSENVQLQ